MAEENTGFADRLARSIKGFRIVWESIAEGEDIHIVEAQTLKALHEEIEDYRRMSGTARVPILQPYSHEKMQDAALRIYRQHHMGRRLLQLIADFVLGEGVQVAAQHEKEIYQESIQEVVDQFWTDPINAMDRKLEQRFIEWNLWGEICMPVRRNDATGEVRIGWITPKSIEDVVWSSETGEASIVVVTDKAAESIGAKELTVIRYVEDDDGVLAMEGDCFYYGVNNVKGGGRGVSELYTASDWLDVLDQTLRAHSDRAKLDSYFIWDVTLVGGTDEQVRDYNREIQKVKPKPNSVKVHNDKVIWKAVSPDLEAYEFSRHIKDLKTYIMGGFGYPNHWFGSGDDANLATAAVMSEPTRKNLRRKQKQLQYMLTDIVRYVLASAQAAGRLPANIDVMGDPFDIQIPDLSGPDIAKVGTAMAQMVGAIAMAEEEGYVSHDSAMDLFATIAAETGIEIDPAVEREKVEADTAKKDVADEDERKKQTEDSQQMMRDARDAAARLEGQDGDDQE